MADPHVMFRSTVQLETSHPLSSFQIRKAQHNPANCIQALPMLQLLSGNHHEKEDWAASWLRPPHTGAAALAALVEAAHFALSKLVL